MIVPVPGHIPDYLRSAFAEYIETGEDPVDVSHNGNALDELTLLTALARCTEIMPNSLCKDLDLPAGSSYAEGVLSCETSLNEQITKGRPGSAWSED
jgi:hypothetical protein